MKLKEFSKKMAKPIFSLEEAMRIGFLNPRGTVRLQLHQWAKRGDLVRLKRGIYGFPERVKNKIDVARALYGPAYVSLEYALHAYGLIPDVVFAITLVTPKVTRRFKTPMGAFIYHHIKPVLFWGYDPETLMGEREKVLVDYFYLHSSELWPKPDCWQAGRWQNLDEVDFNKTLKMGRRFGSKKVLRLVESLRAFGRKHGGT